MLKNYYSPVTIKYSQPKKVEKVTMNMNEVAAYLGVSRTELKKLMREYKLPHIKTGKRFYLFPKEAVDEWLKNTTTKGI